ncbi:hypothetical protein B9Z55_011395 [Caenorhabditis nigoni]|uniref:Uncharacterized protein n=1 Tax=Caenorhabditis nigoni TaxID=1611254 RepID=A0A2G5UJZ0_9PELO|nr:hypothetical protein B9Z55_011395 [Caenorhabditis nigoni]
MWFYPYFLFLVLFFQNKLIQEISSTTPEIYEGPQHGDILDRLRSLVQKVCSAARKKNITFHTIGDENYRIVIDEEPIELIHDEEKNDTLLRFSWRDFSMEKMDGLISITFVLYYVVTEFGNNVDIFDVNAVGRLPILYFELNYRGTCKMYQKVVN